MLQAAWPNLTARRARVRALGVPGLLSLAHPELDVLQPSHRVGLVTGEVHEDERDSVAELPASLSPAR